MGRSTGLEPATLGTTNRCSNQLSYDRREAPWRTRAAPLRVMTFEGKRGSMNETIEKFGYPETLIREYRHWVLLLRPAQVTAGSLVLAAKSNATAYGELPAEAFAEQALAVAELEAMLSAAVSYEKINYLMLMMVDRNVHFHVIPRYGNDRSFAAMTITDSGWPGPPDLKSAIILDKASIGAAVQLLKAYMPDGEKQI